MEQRQPRFSARLITACIVMGANACGGSISMAPNAGGGTATELRAENTAKLTGHKLDDSLIVRPEGHDEPLFIARVGIGDQLVFGLQGQAWSYRESGRRPDSEQSATLKAEGPAGAVLAGGKLFGDGGAIALSRFRHDGTVSPHLLTLARNDAGGVDIAFGPCQSASCAAHAEAPAARSTLGPGEKYNLAGTSLALVARMDEGSIRFAIVDTADAGSYDDLTAPAGGDASQTGGPTTHGDVGDPAATAGPKPPPETPSPKTPADGHDDDDWVPWAIGVGALAVIGTAIWLCHDGECFGDAEASSTPPARRQSSPTPPVQAQPPKEQTPDSQPVETSRKPIQDYPAPPPGGYNV